MSLGRQRNSSRQGPRPRLGARGRRALADRARHQHRLLLLGVWLIASLLFLPALDQQTIEWLHAPSGAMPMALLIVIGFKHALDGMKVVVDDYVHEPGNNFALNTLLLFLAVGGGAIALFALAAHCLREPLA